GLVINGSMIRKGVASQSQSTALEAEGQDTPRRYTRDHVRRERSIAHPGGPRKRRSTGSLADHVVRSRYSRSCPFSARPVGHEVLAWGRGTETVSSLPCLRAESISVSWTARSVPVDVVGVFSEGL